MLAEGPELVRAIAWPAVILLGVLLASAGAVFYRTGVANLDLHALSRVVAILVIVPAIFALGATDQMSRAEAITALSAIAGLFLGSAVAGYEPQRRKGNAEIEPRSDDRPSGL